MESLFGRVGIENTTDLVLNIVNNQATPIVVTIFNTSGNSNVIVVSKWVPIFVVVKS